MYKSNSENILKEGKNCWKISKSARFAPLIDGENYYRAVAEAVDLAEHSVYIAAWDIDSRTRLLRGDVNKTLTEVLTEACTKKPDLKIYILSWDFAVLYAMEREKLMSFKWNLGTPKNITFKLDNECPFGASHHQKIVVADDSLAYTGGMDISNSRWDTREHKDDNPLRSDPLEENYLPYHDIMFAMTGRAAKDFAELFRQRWYTATGKNLPEPDTSRDIWPDFVEPAAENLETAISRTFPRYKGIEEIREIESMYMEIIKRAERYIYIENQYFTSHAVYTALKERLESEDCPEILMVLPKRSPGWLEEATMVNIRSVYIRDLKESDKNDRISFMRPHNGGSGEGFMNIHSKIIIADDEILFGGSANLSNRSLGFDTEVNIAVEAGSSEDKKKLIRNFLTDLLGEHLGISQKEADKTFSEKGSLFETVRLHSSEGRRLEPIENKKTEVFEKLVPDATYLDPEKPAVLDRAVDYFVTPKKTSIDIVSNLKYFRIFMFAATLAVIALLWRFTPLGQYADKETLVNFIRSVHDAPGSYLIVTGGFVVLGMLLMPVTILISAVAAFYEPVTAFFISLTGSVMSASIVYSAGHFAGRSAVDRLLGKRARQIRKIISGKGVLTIAILRLVPVAPFTIVNAAAGAFQIGARKFAIGTAIGMMPGIFAVTVLTNRFMKSLFDPNPVNIAVLAAAAVVFLAGGYYLTKRLRANTR